MRLKQTGYWEFYCYQSWCDGYKATIIGCLFYYIRYLFWMVLHKGICLFRKHDWQEWERVRVEGDEVHYTGVLFYECERCGKELNEGDYVERMLF